MANEVAKQKNNDKCLLLSTRTWANKVAKLRNKGKSVTYKQKRRLMRLLSTRTNANMC